MDLFLKDARTHVFLGGLPGSVCMLMVPWPKELAERCRHSGEFVADEAVERI